MALNYQMLVVKVWYFLYCGGQVFLTPYLPLYLRRDLGYEPWRVGLVQGLRPWVSAPCSLLLCAAADRLGAHRATLLVGFAASVVLRGSLAFVPPGDFAAAVAVILLAEAATAPVGVIADASVVAKCTQDGDYGKQRVWASIGWGALSAAAGALISRAGVRAGMLVYVLAAAPALLAAWLLDPGPPRAPGAGGDGGCARGKDPVTDEVPDARGGDPAAAKASAGPHAAEPQRTHPTPSPSPSPRPSGARRLLLPPLVAAHDGLRTRLLAASLRTPSPRRPLTAGSPARGAAARTHAAAVATASLAARTEVPPAPLFGGSLSTASLAMAAADSDADGGSCSNTPRSTAALLGDRDTLPPPETPPAACSGAAAAGAGARAPAPDAGPQGDEEGVTVEVLLLGPGCSRKPGRLGGGSSGGSGGSDVARAAGGGGAAGTCSAAGRRGIGGGGGGERADREGGGEGALCVLLRPRVLVFMLRALVIGYGLGTQGAFAFLLVQQMGGNELLMGLMLVFSTLTEAPAFQFQSALLERVPLGTVMHASMLLLALRLASYAVLALAPTPWAVLPVELLHGVTFATSWGAGIVTCKRIAPPHLNTTVQSVFAALYGGVGSGLGAILSGLAVQRLGIQRMFALSSAVLLAGWLLTWLLDLAAALAGRDPGGPGPAGSAAGGGSATSETPTRGAAGEAGPGEAGPADVGAAVGS